MVYCDSKARLNCLR